MEDLSSHILDIVENSIRAGASLIEIECVENTRNDLFSIFIKDNGKGMDSQELRLALDPFYTTKKIKKVGLGLSLLSQAAQEAGGRLTVESASSGGTGVLASFVISHLDRKPLGDLVATLVILVVAYPHLDFSFSYIKDEDSFLFDTREIKKVLENVAINEPQVTGFIRKELQKGLFNLRIMG